MSDAVFQNTSLTKGEISPSLYARVDTAAYHAALAACRNFFVDYRGGVSSRPGTAFAGACKSSDVGIRLIQFQLTALQGYLLVIGDQYMRFIKNGGYILEGAIGITSCGRTNPVQVVAPGAGYTPGDLVFITGVTGMTQLNNRYFLVLANGGGAGNLTLGNDFGENVDATNFGTYAGGGNIQRVYTLPTPWNINQALQLKFAQTTNLMVFTHPGFNTYELIRTTDISWSLTVANIGDTQSIPQGIGATPSSPGPTLFGYVVTSIGPDGQESQQSAVAVASSVNIMNTTGSINVNWNPITSALGYNVYRAEFVLGVSGTFTIPNGAAFGFIGTTRGTIFVDSGITPDFTGTPPLKRNPFALSPIVGVNILAGGSGGGPTTFITVTDLGGGGSGAILQPVIQGGVLVGVVIVDGGANYVIPSITFTNITGASASAVLGPSSGTLPAACGFFQQRLTLAATANQPGAFWMSKPGFYFNFGVSNPVQDDDAILGESIVTSTFNEIKHLIPMPGGLIAMMSNGVYQITGGGTNQPVTPTNIVANPQAYNGCNDLSPIVINYNLIYVQSLGSIIRDLTYNLYYNIFTGTDISLMSSHLFYGFTIISMTYSEEPFKLAWFVRNDGTFLSLTYLKEQELLGWARHDTDGQVVQVCSVVEGTTNATYFAVRRFRAEAPIIYIERMADRQFPYGAEDAWCVDAGVKTTQNQPNATCTPTAASGTNVLFNFNAPILAGDATDNGKVIRVGGGIAVITQFSSTVACLCSITQAITNTVNDPAGSVVPLASPAGQWSLDVPKTVFTGLDHLEGLKVSILADGSAVPAQTVVNGTITLPAPATKVIAGLGFQAQVQTLPLDTGEPTIQPKRKKLTALNLRLANARGLKVGRTLGTLVPIKDRPAQTPMGGQAPLVTDITRINVDPLWDVPGQIWIDIDDPLPATILGIIPEVVVGDK